jgi:hypothetical protein
MFVRFSLVAAMALAGLSVTQSRCDAGALGGPRIMTEEVSRYDTDVYHVRFRGGEIAVIRVEGDGDTDLDLKVYDRFGSLIARDIGRTDSCQVTFYVPFTDRYRIEVINLGSVSNVYTIWTN